MKNKIPIMVFVGSACLGFLLTQCSPMNEAPPKEALLDSGGGNGASKTVSLGGAQLTKNNRFIAYVSAVDAALSTVLKPTVGDTPYLIRFVASGDLRPPTADSRVSVTYWMPDMPDMGKTDAVATRKDDGSFQTSVFFGMPGRWQLDIKFKNDTTEDDQTIEVKI